MATFEKTIRENLITIGGDQSGDYGFNLDADSGAATISFMGNTSPDELSSSNNNASVNPPTAGNGISYG